MTPFTSAFLHGLGRLLVGALVAAAPWLAQAQFSQVPAPLCAPPGESAQEIEREFRIDASRHLYKCFPMRIYRGMLPPLVYSVMMVEVELDKAGNIVSIDTVRKPAADEVAPWVHAVIRRAAPFPAPVRMPGAKTRFKEIFLVDKSGLFQTDSLTEGQH